MSEIEPVTDEDVGVAMDAPGMRAILEQDRRRVAERQAARDAMLPRDTSAEQIELLRDEIERLRAENLHWRETAKDRVSKALYDEGLAELATERDALRAEVAKLRAAQANMIDATGAVEAVVSKFPAFDAAKIMVQQEVPDEWAGSRVVIVRVGK